jgi:hypothetical protein
MVMLVILACFSNAQSAMAVTGYPPNVLGMVTFPVREQEVIVALLFDITNV